MGVPTLEVGYTSATTRRQTMKSMMDMWWHWKTTTLTLCAGNHLDFKIHCAWSFYNLMEIVEY
jgi:hypothetical protein